MARKGIKRLKVIDSGVAKLQKAIEECSAVGSRERKVLRGN